MFNPLGFASPAVLEPAAMFDCGCGCSGQTVVVQIDGETIIIKST